MIETKDKQILNLCVLGRDRSYITLIQVQKAIELAKNANLTDVVEMLLFKEEEIKYRIESATKIIEYLKKGGTE